MDAGPVVLRCPAALKQWTAVTEQPLPESVPVSRRPATGLGQSSKRGLETLCSEPTTPPQPPADRAVVNGFVVDGHGGDPRWQNSMPDVGDVTTLARSHSEWAAAGYVLMPAEDLREKKVQEMVADWGALGYLQLPDGEEDTVAPHPGAGMTVQDGPASFGRWVMLRDTASPLQVVEPSDAMAAGGYVRLGSPGAPNQTESANDLVADDGEVEDDAVADHCNEDASSMPRTASPTGEGCLPPAELDELAKEYAALPVLKPTEASEVSTVASVVEVTQQCPATTAKVGDHDVAPPSRLGDKASGLPGLCFDFVTSAERCELYLTESHDQLEEVARSVTEKRGGEVPANWRVEVDLQRKSSKTLAASRPLLARGGASGDNLAYLVVEAQKSVSTGGAKILSEAELPNLAAWGL